MFSDTIAKRDSTLLTGITYDIKAFLTAYLTLKRFELSSFGQQETGFVI